MEIWRFLGYPVADTIEETDDNNDEQVLEALDNISQMLRTRRMSLPATLPTDHHITLLSPCAEHRECNTYQDEPDHSHPTSHHHVQISNILPDLDETNARIVGQPPVHKV